MDYNIDGLAPVVITNKIEITERVFIYQFKRAFNFEAGQVIGISVFDNTDEKMPRMYSIASGNNDELVSILFNVKETGWLTPLLAKKEVGDTIYITAPSGNFLDNNESAFWIATGTGIAPFHSMLQSGSSGQKTLIHGARKLDSFYFEDSFLNVNHLSYIRCCSQEEGNSIYFGRLTQYLKEYNNLPHDQKYYLCGVPEMVVEVRDILIDKGVPYQQIVAEIYF
ncbi:oxidoreductase [Prolixibacteraceae bacterium JC049]|nr:oxidoreductase [Prolixibacteraceae bacterium JC049]